MHNLSDSDLQGLIVEETGQAHDSFPVKRTLACILALKKHANFEEPVEVQAQPVEDTETKAVETNPQTVNTALPQQPSSGIGLNLGYTINLNLPATDNQAVFNAIFKSLKEHLLRDDDA